MSQRESIANLAADLAGLADARCRSEHVSEATMRIVVASHVMAVLTAVAKKVHHNMEDHGEIAPRTFRELRETIHDLDRNLCWKTGMPLHDAATSLVAD